MTWGTLFFYYECPACGQKFKYDFSRNDEFGVDFGACPACGVPGTYVDDGPRRSDDADYPEVD
jgi:hypothetical protein